MKKMGIIRQTLHYALKVGLWIWGIFFAIHSSLPMIKDAGGKDGVLIEASFKAILQIAFQMIKDHPIGIILIHLGAGFMWFLLVGDHREILKQEYENTRKGKKSK